MFSPVPLSIPAMVGYWQRWIRTQKAADPKKERAPFLGIQNRHQETLPALCLVFRGHLRVSIFAHVNWQRNSGYSKEGGQTYRGAKTRDWENFLRHLRFLSRPDGGCFLLSRATPPLSTHGFIIQLSPPQFFQLKLISVA